jgi:hypothetical protein
MTAVEWLEVQIKNTPTVENLMNQLYLFIYEAKEMEKQQIVNAYKSGRTDVINRNNINPIEYYNETFKNKL